MAKDKRPSRIAGKNKHFYYTGINDGVRDDGYIGKRFRPGTWIFTNYLWSSGLAHKSRAAMIAYDHTPKLSIHWIGCILLVFVCPLALLIAWVVVNG